MTTVALKVEKMVETKALSTVAHSVALKAVMRGPMRAASEELKM